MIVMIIIIMITIMIMNQFDAINIIVRITI